MALTRMSLKKAPVSRAPPSYGQVASPVLASRFSQLYHLIGVLAVAMAVVLTLFLESKSFPYYTILVSILTCDYNNNKPHGSVVFFRCFFIQLSLQLLLELSRFSAKLRLMVCFDSCEFFFSFPPSF